MLYPWAKSFDLVRGEIAMESFNRCSHHGSIAMVLSLCNDRFIAAVVCECSPNYQSTNPFFAHI